MLRRKPLPDRDLRLAFQFFPAGRHSIRSRGSCRIQNEEFFVLLLFLTDPTNRTPACVTKSTSGSWPLFPLGHAALFLVELRDDVDECLCVKSKLSCIERAVEALLAEMSMLKVTLEDVCIRHGGFSVWLERLVDIGEPCEEEEPQT